MSFPLGWIAGVILAVLLNVTANRLPDKYHDPFLRWGWFGILLYFTYLVMSIEFIQQRVLTLAASKAGSYLIAALVGAVIAAVYWAGVNAVFSRLSQQQPTLEEVKPSEVKVDEPKPNLIPVGYGKLFVVYNPATKTFTEADSGIPALVARFRNDTERGKAISEAKDIRAHIIFEPSEFYEKLSKGIKDAAKNTPGFGSVHDGIWLNEKNAVLNFGRGETKTLIIAVQMQDDGFGGFDAFEHRVETINGNDLFLPRIPKLTADKYVVKVVLSGGEHGDIEELHHFTVTLRPEFDISYG